MKYTIAIFAFGNVKPVRRLIQKLHSGLPESEIIIAGLGPCAGRLEEYAGACKVITGAAHEYGLLLRRAFEISNGDYLLALEANEHWNLDEILKTASGPVDADLLIFSRYARGANPHMHPLRMFYSQLGNLFLRWLLTLPFTDFTSSVRIYSKRIFPELKLSSDNYEILVESAVKTYCLGYTVREAPCTFRDAHFISAEKTSFALAKALLANAFRMWRLRNSLFSADYDERAYNSSIPLQRYWQRKRFKILTDFINTEDAEQLVLDIGCGSSKVVQSIPRVVGLDIDLKKLRFLKKKDLQLVRGDIKALPFRDGLFDVVVCSEVIEHLPEGHFNLDEIKRVLKPGGRLILGTPDYSKKLWKIIEWFYYRLLPGAYASQHITHYTSAGLKRLLEERGFKILRTAYICRSEFILETRLVK